MRIYSIKDVSHFFIEGVGDGPMVDFTVQLANGLISIYRVSQDRYELFEVPYTQIQTATGLVYQSPIDTYNYILEELTPVPQQPPALKGTYQAAEEISALKAVYFSGDGVVSLASNAQFSTSLVVGVSLTAADPGQNVDVRLFGVVSDQTFTLGINNPLFLTQSGNYSLQPPSTGTLTRLGKSLGTGTIFVKIEEPIQLQGA